MCIKIGNFLFYLCVSDREDLTRQIKDTGDKQLQNNLTKQLNSVVARMEAKGEQIVTLKRCQDMVTDLPITVAFSPFYAACSILARFCRIKFWMDDKQLMIYCHVMIFFRFKTICRMQLKDGDCASNTTENFSIFSPVWMR